MSMSLDVTGLLDVSFYLKVGQEIEVRVQSGTYNVESGLEEWFLTMLRRGYQIIWKDISNN